MKSFKYVRNFLSPLSVIIIFSRVRFLVCFLLPSHAFVSSLMTQRALEDHCAMTPLLSC